MARKIDWDKWRKMYVESEMELRSISEVPGAPKYQSLKNRSSAENWAEQRKNYKYLTSTHASLDPTLKVVAEEAQKTVADVTAKMDRLIDQAELITRHLKISKKMQAIAATGLNVLDGKSMKPDELLRFIKEATTLERLCMDMETQRSAISINEQSLSDERDRIRDRSPEELAREYREAL